MSQSQQAFQQVSSLMEIGARLLVSGQVQEAFSTTIQAKALRTPCKNLDLLRAQCFIKLNRYDEALEATKEELRFFPDNQAAEQLLSDLQKALQVNAAPQATNDAEFNELLRVVRPYTMLSVERLYSLFTHAKRLCQSSVPGNFVECGVAAGGSSAILAYVISRYSTIPRFVYCFDSFSGMPPAGAHDTHSGQHAETTGWGSGTCSAPRKSLEEVCTKVGAQHCIRPVEGFFEDTLPKMKEWVGMVALLHLDGDWYSSTKAILDNLYDKISDGGILQVDDFGYWDGCRKAVNEFFASRDKKPQLTQIDGTGVWFEKPDKFPVNEQLSYDKIASFYENDITRHGVVSQMSENERFQLYYAARYETKATNAPLRFIEVGSYAGASLLLTYIAMKRTGLPVQGYAVEPQGQPQFHEIVRVLGSEITHLPLYSHDAAIKLNQQFQGAGTAADFILIDGDHTYEGVRKDIQDYFPLLKVGGIIMFHDYLPALNDSNRAFVHFHHANTEPGIRRACDEFFGARDDVEEVILPLLKPTDPTQTQAFLPLIPGVFSTIKAWRRTN